MRARTGNIIFGVTKKASSVPGDANGIVDIGCVGEIFVGEISLLNQCVRNGTTGGAVYASPPKYRMERADCNPYFASSSFARIYSLSIYFCLWELGY